MRKILLDTSVIVDFIRRKDREDSLLYQLAEAGYKFSTSIITHTEIYCGKSVWEKDTARKEAERMFSQMQILPLEYNISRKAGEIKAYSNIGVVDAIIAATALVHNLDLVTLNRKHFENVDSLRLFSS